MDPNVRWYRRAIDRVRGHTYDAYPDHEVPWHVVDEIGPTVPVRPIRARIPRRTHPVSLYVKRYGRLREVKLLGSSLEIAVDKLNRRLMGAWVMNEIAETLAQMEEEEMDLEHKEGDDNVRGGQGLAEYALILALIAIVAIAALLILGNQIQGVLQSLADCLPGGAGC